LQKYKGVAKTLAKKYKGVMNILAKIQGVWPFKNDLHNMGVNFSGITQYKP